MRQVRVESREPVIAIAGREMAKGKPPKEDPAPARRVADHAELASALQQLALNQLPVERSRPSEDAPRVVSKISDKAQPINALQELILQVLPVEQQPILPMAELFVLKRIATLALSSREQYAPDMSDDEYDRSISQSHIEFKTIKEKLLYDIYSRRFDFYKKFNEIIKLIDDLSNSIDIQFVIEAKDKLKDLLSRPDDRPTELPDAPSKLWIARGPGRPKPGWEESLFAFIREVYGPYFEAGLQNHIRAYIYRHDRPLYDAIKQYERRDRALPADIVMPTRRDIVAQRFERAKRDGLHSLSGPERHSVVRKLKRDDPNP